MGARQARPLVRIVHSASASSWPRAHLTHPMAAPRVADQTAPYGARGEAMRCDQVLPRPIVRVRFGRFQPKDVHCDVMICAAFRQLQTVPGLFPSYQIEDV
jgi:hypothetical protein